jgi:GT2 family glycosyltransferase/tetratricopeptide (TPR) repeat protein/SAM-dependent methyltransferase
MNLHVVPYPSGGPEAAISTDAARLLPILADEDWICFAPNDARPRGQDWYTKLCAVIEAVHDPCVILAGGTGTAQAWAESASPLIDVALDELCGHSLILMPVVTLRRVLAGDRTFADAYSLIAEMGLPLKLAPGIVVRNASDWRDPPDPRLNVAQFDGLLRLMPASASRVLWLLPPCPPDTATAIRDRIRRPERTDAFHIATEDDLTLPESKEGCFDVIVCLKVVQYCSDPERLLVILRQRLAPTGTLILTVLNLRHRSTVLSLMYGKWAPLSPSDRRFFTRREGEKLLYRAGFDVVEVLPCPAAEPGSSLDSAASPVPDPLRMPGVSEEELSQLRADEFWFVGRPRPREEFGLTSIVIVTHNQIGFTRQCLDSIRRHTDVPFELVFVENGSQDGTAQWLNSLPDVRCIANPDNRGFPAAANQGVRVARGDQVLLLNNDTIVTTGWLRRMLRAMRADESIGLVGPCSNNVSGEQRVPVNYGGLGDLDGFAWEWGKSNNRQVQDVSRLVGFCLLVRREVIDRIGLLDERFGIGTFEDDDYTLRARQAGFRAVIARDAFVHHAGSATFGADKVDLHALMRDNAAIFEDKWQRLSGPAAAATVAPSAPDSRARSRVDRPVSVPLDVAPNPAGANTPGRLDIARAPGGGLLLVPRAGRASGGNDRVPRLSLCMIVRDSAATLPACLESIRPWVDEMVIVDTGSRDRTPAIVERYGATLFYFPWCDDFSAARNESVRHARGEWVFWMDSDDTIDAECGRRLRALAYGNHDPTMLGYVMQVHCPAAPDESGFAEITAVDHVKLFRNLPALRFTGRIHEQILPAIRRAGGEVGWTDLFVTHSGSDHAIEAHRRKWERDLRILGRELEDKPGDSFTLFNIGMTYADKGDHAKAVDVLRQSLGASNPSESHVRKIYALLIASLTALGQWGAAHDICEAGLGRFPDDPELLFRGGMLAHQAGNLVEAERAYLRVLQDRTERHFASIDRGIAGFKTRHNLAVVYADMGQCDAAEREWRAVLHEVPTFRPAWRGLGDCLLRQGKLDEATVASQRLQRDTLLHVDGLILAAEVAKAKGNLDQARSLFEQAAFENPANGEDSPALGALAQFLFENASPPEAEPVLVELTRRRPQDAASHHNLGTLYLRLGQHAAAVDAYRTSLKLRPDSAETQKLLRVAEESSKA